MCAKAEKISRQVMMRANMIAQAKRFILRLVGFDVVVMGLLRIDEIEIGDNLLLDRDTADLERCG